MPCLRANNATACSKKDETQNGRRNRNRNPRWSKVGLLFKWAVWKETCNDDQRFWFPFRWLFQIAPGLSGTGCSLCWFPRWSGPWKFEGYPSVAALEECTGSVLASVGEPRKEQLGVQSKRGSAMCPSVALEEWGLERSVEASVCALRKEQHLKITRVFICRLILHSIWFVLYDIYIYIYIYI